jgi:NADPH:quinone reductase-like Zn-dependent oxidoreductase
MKAVRIHQFGGSEVLQLEEAPIPSIADDEVLVKVIATSINPVDWKIREGYLKDFLPHKLPLIMGWDVSGIIEKVGASVSGWKQGDAVFSRPDLSRDGAYAEFTAIRAKEIAKKPKTISFADSASIPLAGITAHEAVIRLGEVKRGQTVLIHAGAGGVGSLAIQIAKERGAIVHSTGSSSRKYFLQQLGVDQFLDYNHNWDRYKEFYDLVLDTVGGETQSKSLPLVQKEGVFVSVTDSIPEEKCKALGIRGEFLFIQPNPKILEDLGNRMESGTLRAVVGEELPLNQIRKAHDLSQSKRSTGKIVIHIGSV